MRVVWSGRGPEHADERRRRIVLLPGARKGLAHACMRTGRLRLKTDAVQQRWPEGLIEELAPKLDRQKRVRRVAPSRQFGRKAVGEGLLATGDLGGDDLQPRHVMRQAPLDEDGRHPAPAQRLRQAPPGQARAIHPAAHASMRMEDMSQLMRDDGLQLLAG